MQSTLKRRDVKKTECLISVDIETLGPTPGKYSMYELGACVVGVEYQQFHANISLPPSPQYKEEALRVVGIDDIRVITLRKAEKPDDALSRFISWVKNVSGTTTPVFVANNAHFDWMFVAWYFEEFGLPNPFGHSALDMKVYFMGLTGCSWKDATLANMAKHAGIDFVRLPHQALEDAIIQSRIFSTLLHLPKEQS